jgi:glycosyltransferase involved in cell wall biosynthesis
MRACTVISAAQLPQARTLAAALGDGSQLTALVLDEPPGAQPFEVLRPHALEGVDIWKLYGLPERALRRYLEPFLLGRFSEPVVLLAPDVRVRGPLDALLGGGPALVPRVLEPAGEEALGDGLYDSGVLGWGPGGARVLAWWRERVEERLREDADGPHVLDAAPALFEEVTVVRDPAYGVADWNLHEAGRSAEQAVTLREVGAEPTDPVIPLGRLANGTAVDDALRDVIRDAAGRGIELADLDTEAGTHRLLEWANGPADQGAVQGVTRYLLALHGRRLDLHDTFQALEDDDGEAFVQWARTTGRADGIPDVLLPLPAPESAPPQGPPPLGVNVAGYLRTGLGVGEAARLYVAALEAAQVPVRTETADPGLPKPKRTGFQDRRPAVEYPFNLVCVNAFELPTFARHIGAGFFEGRITIGSWAWEASKVPDSWDEAFALVDEIWTYSDYVTNVLAAAAPVPVVTIPQPVLPPRVADRPPDLGLPDAFTFLFTFDFFSTTRRKHPVGLVQAYTRAFGPGDGTQLVIKTFNGDAKPESLRELLRAVGDRDDVHVIDRYLPVQEKNALVAQSDCYVSLHRAEGFGLSLAEAMLLGKPVVATGYSGNLQFMTPANSWLVGYELTQVGPGSAIYPADAEWADPDLDHAAALLREVRAGGDAVRERAERGRRDVAASLSPERTGAAARARLERLLALAPGDAPQPGSARAGLALQSAREKAAYDPERTGGGAGDLPRKATLRAMRPYTHHQRELNDRLVDALEEQARRLDELQEEVRRGKHGIAAARRQSLAAEWRVEELQRRLAERDGDGA